jgi:hypothetical protein
VALLSLLQDTARIKESRAAYVQARRTSSNEGCPVKIEEPDIAREHTPHQAERLRPASAAARLERAETGNPVIGECRVGLINWPMVVSGNYLPFAG